MFDIIKKLYGEGHIYADIVCEDGSTGRTKSPYIGDPETLNRQEFIQQIKKEIWFKYGKEVSEVTNIRIS